MSLGMFAAVAAGGALGAMTRYAVSLGLGAGMFGVPGPLATLAVNVVGSAMMGILAGLVAAGIAIPEVWRGFVAVGFLGALTTFSSFALDTGTLMARQGLSISIVYVGLSVLLSLVAFFSVQGLVAGFLARAT
ncbi:MAG: CrcB family protein [Pseudomonadota bacterium]|nr:CrcB family protein [Pseudomonadota bacterium]